MAKSNISLHNVVLCFPPKYIPAYRSKFCVLIAMSKIKINNFRGGLIIKRRENFGHFSKLGGGRNTQKCLKFKFGHLKTHGGGGLNFSKMSEL